ncbi:MAG: nucleotide exchange factor GrpE [Bacteroidetes bacterium]|nr:MAG: nucleotide exchange factor GrpE [Bacteroidota bacterium]REK05100.1 MAG: nucleotide exchange factor GrpE [Bacteroidota bacterium]REK32506.1 MAG: nucleotide exchange factor GrpE [Bacteroidota bacterium]REK49047.1 MAG: nucleotide exchange factor GrpE [Bacteroidota bacterium]
MKEKDMKQKNDDSSLVDDNTDLKNNGNPPTEAALPDAESQEADPIAKLEVELSEYKDKYLRLYSEFDNYKKRVARDREDQRRFITADVFRLFLPLIDDMERAQKSFEGVSEIEPLREGMNLVFQKLRKLTESGGLKEMDVLGQTFDPDLHDAISNAPAPSDDLKGKVIDVIEKGYILNDRVIRHAKVIVGN